MTADCDDRFQPLPIGIESKHTHVRDYPTCDPAIYHKLRTAKPEKTNDVLLSFSSNTNYSAREPVIKHFKKFAGRPWITIRPFGKTEFFDLKFAIEYLEVLSHHKFVVSPFGRGYDCHRSWEAWYLGTFPIILRHAVFREWMDLPAWWIDDWSEVQPELVDQKYAELCQQSFPTEKLTFAYWNSKIGGSDPIPAGSNT